MINGEEILEGVDLTMYFGNGFTVENHWKGGKQIKDLYFYNGKLQRRKNYEE